MKQIFIIFAAMAVMFGQAKDTSPRSIGSYTVATLPAAASWSGYIAIVTDAATAGSCTSGGGSERSLCRSNGSAWVTFGSAIAGSLGANGTNCSAGSYPLGVDASGNSETCTSLATQKVRSFGGSFVSSDGVTALTAGATSYYSIPYACTISAWTISVNAGTATVDIWKVATGTAIPVAGNTITASATPAIAANTHVRSTTLTGWTTSIAANDVIGINLEVVATATYVNLTVECNQ